jgi:virulence factor BrkB
VALPPRLERPAGVERSAGPRIADRDDRALALLYRVLPDVHLGWRDVTTGAFVTAVLFTLGQQLIGLYLGQSSMASSYDAAGSVMILLLWVYYSCQILLLGAEFTRVYAEHRGTTFDPEYSRNKPDAFNQATPASDSTSSSQRARPRECHTIAARRKRYSWLYGGLTAAMTTTNADANEMSDANRRALMSIRKGWKTDDETQPERPTG